MTDNDGSTWTNNVQVTVLKRGTTTSYTGPLESTPSRTITLTAKGSRTGSALRLLYSVELREIANAGEGTRVGAT